MELGFGLFLHAGAHRVNAEGTYQRVVFFRKYANLLLGELRAIQEVQMALIQRLNTLVVSLCDHAVADLEALIRQHISVCALDVDDSGLEASHR